MHGKKAEKWSLKEKRDQFFDDLIMDDQVSANYIAWLEEGWDWAEAEREKWDNFLESEETFKEDVRSQQEDFGDHIGIRIVVES